MRQRWGVAAFACLVCSSAAQASAGGVAVSGEAGTLGFGVGLTGRLARTLNLRAVFHPGPTLSYSGTSGDDEYDFELQLRSAGGQLDWHPGGGGFHLSGGVILNRNKLDGTGTSPDSYTIGDNTYTVAQVGTLRSAIDFKKAAPYAGIGFGNAVGEGKHLGVVFDLGVVFAGSPRVALTATGPIAGNATFQQDLASEEQSLSDDLKAFKYYPVLSLALSYQF